MDAALFAESAAPGTFKTRAGPRRLARAHKTTPNCVTAWWDASQIYGYDERSRRRVKRDPADPAKLCWFSASGAARRRYGYLPQFAPPASPADDENCDPIQPEWVGQEAAAFPDNWSIGPELLPQPLRPRAQRHRRCIPRMAKQASPTRIPVCAIPTARPAASPTGQIRRRTVRNRAADRRRGDRQDPHHRVDAAAPLQRAAQRRHEFQLVRLFRTSRSPPHHQALVAELRRLGRRQGRATSSTPRLPPGRDRRPGTADCQLPAGWPMGPWTSATRDVNGGHQPFRLAVQFPGGVRLGLSAACAGAGHDRVSRLRQSERDRGAGSDRRNVPWQGAPIRCIRAAWPTGRLSMGRQRLGLLLLRNHPQFLQNLDLRPRIDTTIDVPRSISSATASAAFRVLTSSGVRSDCAVDELRRFHRPRLPKDSPETRRDSANW